MQDNSRSPPSARENRDRAFVRPRRHFVAAYVQAHERGQLAAKAEHARERLASCCLCPRRCRANRGQNQTGFCATGRWARVASAFPHLGEENCLRGWRGSGTIFFAGCNLGCVFCQNHDVSQPGEGRELDARQLASLMLRLQEAGCHNLNLVTPTHVAPQILEALPFAVEGGLRLPLVYNTGGYDSLASIRSLGGVVDIYMPDFKLWDPAACASYLRAPDYAEAARAAIKAMHEQVGVLQWDEQGLALRGVLVRHLVMPGRSEDTRAILDWLATELSPDTYLNLMDQYRPAHKAVTSEFQEINRPLATSEFRRAQDDALAARLWRLDGRFPLPRAVLEKPDPSDAD